jgi:L,D-transpeptidase ErfK/SrfK
MLMLLRRGLMLLLVLCIVLIGMIVTAARARNDSHVIYDAAMSLKVDLSNRELYVIENGDVVRTYGVAVGSRKHPTPTGRYWTGRIIWNPRWVPPPSKWARKLKARAPGDPRNPMQGVKIYFREPWFYIHGTNAPGSIGSASSHGCIRMRTRDAKRLAKRISEHGSVLLVIQH